MDRRAFLRSAAVVPPGLAAAGCLPGGASSGSSDRGTTIVVNTRKPCAKVSPFTTGVNFSEWYNDADGLWDSDKNAPVPEIVSKVKQAGIALVRYPGGTSANLFNWQGAVGPQSERTQQVSGFKRGGPVDSRFGPDEYMTFIKEIDGTPQIMAPLVNSTPEEVAAWVAYMNAPEDSKWGRLRAKNGHPEPYGVRYWELGNELDHKGNQRYWRSDDDDKALKQYAFGGTQRQTRQPVGTPYDRRPAASQSDGEPDQSFAVWFPPVVPKSQVVRVGGDTWHEVDELSSAGPRERVYTFEPSTGTISFGDGEHGKIPSKGDRISADYDSGPHAGFVDYYKAMKEVDPSIDVIATWAPIGSGKLAPGKSFPQLMAEHGHADDYDGVSIHPYTNFSRDLDVSRFPDKRAGHDYQMVGEAAAGKMVTDLADEVQKYGKRGAYVAVSEAGALFFSGKDPAAAYPEYNNAMSHALYMASQWVRFSVIGIPWVVGNTVLSDKEGVSRAVFGSAPEFVVTPDALVREQLRDVFHGGGQVLDCAVRENVSVSMRKTPLGSSYEALMAMATLDREGALSVVVVNRSPDKAVKAEMAPEGFSHSGTVEVSVVAGGAYDDANDEEHPRSVAIETSRRKASGKSLACTFGAHSVTLLRFASSRR